MLARLLLSDLGNKGDVMKTSLRILVLTLASTTMWSVHASDCAFVQHPLSPAAVAAQLAPIAGIYEFMGAQDITVDGKQMYGKDAVSISRDGVQLGFTVYPSLFQPFVGFQISREYTPATARISGPIAELDGAIILEIEKDYMCHAVAIRVRGNKLCRSQFVTRNYSDGFDSLKGCLAMEKAK
jgi:hypothetical protein